MSLEEEKKEKKMTKKVNDFRLWKQSQFKEREHNRKSEGKSINDKTVLE